MTPPASDSPLVSILIPAYASESMLGEAIESALNQTHPRVEVVVVDDGSPDGTFEIARQFEAAHPDQVRAFTQPNAGACMARNQAFAESCGDYVKFLDADDALTPNAIAAQLAALEGEPEEVIPYGEFVRCDAALQPKTGKGTAGQPGTDAAFSEDVVERVMCLLKNNIQTARPLHPRRFVEAVQGFDERLGRAQEYDFHLRIALAGGRFKRVDQPGVYIRDHDAPTRIANLGESPGVSGKRLRKNASKIKLMQDAFGDDLPEPIRRFLSRAMWRAVRADVQAGKLQSARSLATRAKSLDPQVQFAEPAVIRSFYRTLGPIRTEFAYKAAKHLRRKLRMSTPSHREY